MSWRDFALMMLGMGVGLVWAHLTWLKRQRQFHREIRDEMRRAVEQYEAVRREP